MAPEQALGQPATARSDLYALGAAAYEALTGRPYIAADGHGPYGILEAIVRGPRGERALVPEPWDGFLRRALATRPEDRFPDAAAMLAALREGPAAPPRARAQAAGNSAAAEAG